MRRSVRFDVMRVAILAGLTAMTIWSTGCKPSQPQVPTQAEATGERPVTTQKATFAAGCFWGVQAGFDMMPGVVSTSVGYTGGHTEKPTYEDVCGDQTGHAEAIEIVFEPARVSYDKLLEYFFRMHDPTTPNRQGPDEGTQYRSVVFFHSPEQERAAKAMVEKLTKSGKFPNPIVTQIVPAGKFWLAEDYHQKYFAKTGRGACHVMP